MYWAVSTFGPDWTLQPRVEAVQTCRPSAGGAVCTSTPTMRTIVVVSPAVDLSDPAVLALALSKANADDVPKLRAEVRDIVSDLTTLYLQQMPFAHNKQAS